ncbi:hypothetical protein [Nocardioides speluncae]|uniref:hypothetical protein n=1 Tax=Nocardioides speluncae TaxID=2670337 RepID=UPI0012B16DD7|nr:hypothetical protein [Nocardioides speluncae]
MSSPSPARTRTVLIAAGLFAAGSVVTAVGVSAATAAPDRSSVQSSANGNGTTCDKLGYTKIDSESGSVTLDAGTITWGGNTLTFTPNPGWTIELCIKGGNQVPIYETGPVGADGVFTYTHPQGISHIGYRNPDSSEPSPTSHPS